MAEPSRLAAIPSAPLSTAVAIAPLSAAGIDRHKTALFFHTNTAKGKAQKTAQANH
jgi:hypothetical protein